MKYLFVRVIVLVGIGMGVWFLSDASPLQKSDTSPLQKEVTRTSADNAPSGSIHNLPVPEAVAAVRTLVARELNVNKDMVIVMTAYEKEWLDTCLGLAATKDEMCAEIITPGYEVTVQAQNKQFVYHTNADGTILKEKK